MKSISTLSPKIALHVHMWSIMWNLEFAPNSVGQGTHIQPLRAFESETFLLPLWPAWSLKHPRTNQSCFYRISILAIPCFNRELTQYITSDKVLQVNGTLIDCRDSIQYESVRGESIFWPQVRSCFESAQVFEKPLFPHFTNLCSLFFRSRFSPPICYVGGSLRSTPGYRWRWPHWSWGSASLIMRINPHPQPRPL